jgi:hypothetical protein
MVIYRSPLILEDPHTMSVLQCEVSSLILTETERKMKDPVLWDITPRGSCKNRRFGGT